MPGSTCLWHAFLGKVTDSVDVNLSELQETAEDRGSWHAAVQGVAKSQTRLNGHQKPKARETKAKINKQDQINLKAFAQQMKPLTK